MTGGSGGRILVVGRQGAGKGTQCERLAAQLEVPHIATGDVLRDAVRHRSALGREAERFMQAGELVPDDLICRAVADRLARPDTSEGFVLDGFPRTRAQGEALVALLGSSGLDVAILLDVPADVVQQRLAARRVCSACHATCVAPDPAMLVVPCTRCGRQAVQRTDDTPEAIRRRLALFEQQTAPLLAWLDELGILVLVDGLGTPDEVTRRVMAAAQTPSAAGTVAGSTQEAIARSVLQAIESDADETRLAQATNDGAGLVGATGAIGPASATTASALDPGESEQL